MVLSLASVLVFAGFSINQEAHAGDVGPLGDFVCWTSTEPAAVQDFAPSPHTIVDQFDEISHEQWTQSEYCTAANKFIDGQSFFSPFPLLDQHYQGWFYSGPLHNPNPAAINQNVNLVVSQFGYDFDAKIIELDEIMVPATKYLPSDGGFPNVPRPSANTMHHWNCYGILDLELNVLPPPPPQMGIIDLETQHGPIANIQVLSPFLLCAPMIKDGTFLPNNGLDGEHMVCYDILAGTDHTIDHPTDLEDQIAGPVPFQIDFQNVDHILGLEKLCVPAIKSVIPPPVVGGFDVSINTSSLLLAGVQSVSMWMIPVVIAGVGIGIFVIKRRQ